MGELCFSPRNVAGFFLSKQSWRFVNVDVIEFFPFYQRLSQDSWAPALFLHRSGTPRLQPCTPAGACPSPAAAPEVPAPWQPSQRGVAPLFNPVLPSPPCFLLMRYSFCLFRSAFVFKIACLSPWECELHQAGPRTFHLLPHAQGIPTTMGFPGLLNHLTPP